MLIKVFYLKSNIFNHYVAEYHNAKQVTDAGFEWEILTENNERIRWRADLYGLEIEVS